MYTDRMYTGVVVDMLDINVSVDDRSCKNLFIICDLLLIITAFRF